MGASPAFPPVLPCLHVLTWPVLGRNHESFGPLSAGARRRDTSIAPGIDYFRASLKSIVGRLKSQCWSPPSVCVWVGSTRPQDMRVGPSPEERRGVETHKPMSESGVHAGVQPDRARPGSWRPRAQPRVSRGGPGVPRTSEDDLAAARQRARAPAREASRNAQPIDPRTIVKPRTPMHVGPTWPARRPLRYTQRVEL